MPKIIKICPNCGNKFETRTNVNEKTYCNFQCYNMFRQGSNSSSWKGGIVKNKNNNPNKIYTSNGYVRIMDKTHPAASKKGYVKEHIKVVVDKHGYDYFVNKGGVVHHINGIKDDNRLENLYTCSNSENAQYNQQLLDIAFGLVQKGHILFNNGVYSCPLISNDEDEVS